MALNENAYKFWAIKIVTKGRDSGELELWKHFSHPNLPEVVDVIVTETEFLIVMDYIEGRNAAKILKEQGKVKPSQAVIWGIRLLSRIVRVAPTKNVANWLLVSRLL